VVNDTTERHNLQEQIEERQLMLNLFFEQSLEGFFFMNFANSQHLEEQLSLEQKIQYSYENLIITRNNRALEMLYGYDESQMIGLSMKSLFSLDSDLAKELLGNLFTTGNAKPDTKHIHKNGFMLRFEGNYIILRNRKQRVIGIFGIQRDISEKHRTIELLKYQNRKINESNNAKDNFFSIIAHDLKSPFNAIYGFSQLIAEAGNNKDFSQVVAYSEHIVKASQFSVELIDNLLEWARTQRDGIYIETTKVNIGEVMQQISNLMAIQYTSKEVELRVKIPENCTINADKNMIFTILRNLCSNALKFSFPNSIVEMIVIQNAIQTEVTISDTGIGMTSSEIALLFGNENKTMKPGTANEKGTGLGLKLCYEFVKMHGGEIWAESTPGLGSSFHFTIPSTPQEA
jgi:PAS domain S-box-containing protein